MELLSVEPTASKEEKYRTLLPQLKNILENEVDTIANYANTSAVLKQVFNFLWVGFILSKKINSY